MPRLPELELDALDDEQRRIADEITGGPRGGLSGPFRPWLNSPVLADRAQKLGAYVRYDTSLPPRLSELAILFTARHWTAQFEWYAHAPMARTGGLPDDVIDAIQRGDRPDFAADDEAAVYDFCVELYETSRVSDPTYARVVKHLGTRGAVDLVGILGYYALVSMTLNVFEVTVPDGESLPLSEDLPG